MINAKIISSLDKCLPDQKIGALDTLKSISVLRGERLSFQLAVRDGAVENPYTGWYRPVVTGSLAKYTTIRRVDFIPSKMPVYAGEKRSDADYISKKPGLFPDLLSELGKDGSIPVNSFRTNCVWFTVEIPKNCKPGRRILGVELYAGENRVLRKTLAVNVIAATLPEQTMPVTQWFHTDCLADYYKVPVFSEEYWRIVENFARTAVRGGINTLLTPIFTPPLDTAEGGERPTVQLVGVTLEDGKYSFDYSKLDRWCDMCDRVGIKNFEISHLFTQWGAAHAPKVMAAVDGEYRRIFGWDSSASEGEYPRFLRIFLPDFLAHMKARGDDKRCIFHISDEPTCDNLAQYTASRAVVADILEGYTTMDALSNIEFWKNGLVKTPVVAINHIEPFIEAKPEKLWAYYCCGQNVGVSNRYFAMPGARTRFIGMQFYKYDIAGFLQWGYNFYFNQGSRGSVNPYADSTGDYFVPSGDTYSVYPSADGRALESLRFVEFHEALQDLSALKLCESLCGREKTLAAVEEICGNIVFSHCVCDSKTMLALRERVNDLIKENI